MPDHDNNDDLIEIMSELKRQTKKGELVGVVAVFEHANGKTSIMRGGTGISKPEHYQNSLAKLMIDNTVYPDQYYIIKAQS